ncbi:MAG: 2Fe-2S iron-sulfur cluster binding domain-containing protein [Moritella sp.]|uniref:2Fe-2S iron-sulfur cluster-binding protein n=1 Tax=Moritella sp. TaxID=78556 RepID=UPI001DB3A632|nr:2Fe-2S iron-sulfur cluster-binding protein [Moritella sp.]NQZ48625.1 2Fe-2S iron-sulfur cluster binding domain-containing protein [Moritella sp.]
MFSLIKRAKRFKIDSSYGEFSCKEGETVLAAANRNGVYIPHQCTVGTCNSCSCKINGLDVLACRYKPQSDCQLKYQDETLFKTELIESSHIGESIYQVKILLDDKHQYPIGSYINVYVDRHSKSSRKYSVVENGNSVVTIHVKRHKYGVISNPLTSMNSGDVLYISEASGNYILPSNNRSYESCYGFANGSAFGVTASIVSDFLTENTDSNATLIALSRNKETNLYYEKVSKKIMDKHSNRIKIITKDFEEVLNQIDNSCPSNSMIFVCGSNDINKAFNLRKDNIESNKSILIQESF